MTARRADIVASDGWEEGEAMKHDEAIRALHAERRLLQRANRLGKPFDAKRLRYVCSWIDVLEVGEAYLQGAPWTKEAILRVESDREEPS